METEWPRVTTTAVEHPICEANEPWKHIARAERALWFIRAGPKRNRNLPTTPLPFTPPCPSVRPSVSEAGMSPGCSALPQCSRLFCGAPAALPCSTHSGPPCHCRRRAAGFRPKLCGRPLTPSCSLPPTSRTPKIGSSHRQAGREGGREAPQLGRWVGRSACPLLIRVTALTKTSGSRGVVSCVPTEIPLPRCR